MKERNKNIIDCRRTTCTSSLVVFSYGPSFCCASVRVVRSQAEKKVILSAPVGQIPASSQLVPLCWGSCGLNQEWQKQQPPLPVSEQKMNGCGTRWKAMLNLMELVYGESSTQNNFICLPTTNEIHLFCTSWQIQMCQNIRVTKVGGLHWQLWFFVAHWFKSVDFKQILYWSLGQSWTQFSWRELWCVNRFIWLVSSWKQSH